jgi:DNA-binding protein H-NS
VTKTYIEMLAEIESLRKQAEAVREKEVRDVIARIKEAIAAYGLSASDLGLGSSGRPAPSVRGGIQRKAKQRDALYRDSAGNTWSGRGPRPKWFKAALASGVRAESLLNKASK